LLKPVGAVSVLFVELQVGIVAGAVSVQAVAEDSVTVRLQFPADPSMLATATEATRVADAPAVTVTWLVPAPAVIVPPVTVQA
jgi:hypothetical protein